MLPIVTPSEMQAIDRRTIAEFDVSGYELMDRAGKSVADFLFKKFPTIKNKKIAILCGKGNNGGDGFVAAYHLRRHQVRPSVFVLGRKSDLKNAALQHFRRLTKAGCRVRWIDSEAMIGITKPDIIIDALLGTGSQGALNDPLLAVVRWVATCKQDGAYVLAIDIPSGLNGETGMVGSTAVVADDTVTIGAPKTGLIFGSGKDYTGALHIADIGFPSILLETGKLRHIQSADVRSEFPSRRIDAQKYDFGKLLIMAGSRGMSGAALLCARAAMRSGVGLIRSAVPRSIAHVIEVGLPEAMTVSLEETTEGTMALSETNRLREQLEWCDAAVIGPGLSRNPETVKLIRRLIETNKKPLILDADGINAFEGESAVLHRLTADLIITPHSGELARLFALEKESVQKDRKAHLEIIKTSFGKTILLKGAPTLIAGHDKIFVTNTGNPGMATAGSGDVLSGMIGALMTQGLDSEKSGYSAAFLHGSAGDLAARRKTQWGMIASDIVECLPEAIERMGGPS